MNLLENENNTKEDDAAVYISFLSKSYQLLEDLINKLVCLVQFIRNLTTSMTSLMLEPLGAIFLILLILESETLIQIKIEFLMHSN